MQKINIRIYSDGTVESKTNGIKGSSCQNYIKEIEKLTGINYKFIKNTSEFYETEQEEIPVIEINSESV